MRKPTAAVQAEAALRQRALKLARNNRTRDNLCQKPRDPR
jgi:hypothetical protein